MSLIMRGILRLVDSLARGKMHRIVVNLRTANVFNGIFETGKSTRNAEKKTQNSARARHGGPAFTTPASTMTRC